MVHSSPLSRRSHFISVPHHGLYHGELAQDLKLSILLPNNSGRNLINREFATVRQKSKEVHLAFRSFYCVFTTQKKHFGLLLRPLLRKLPHKSINEITLRNKMKGYSKSDCKALIYVIYAPSIHFHHAILV